MLIKNGLVLDHKHGFLKKDILVEDSKVVRIEDEIKMYCENIIDASDCYVVPGFIDIHTHGANGYDTMTATYDALNNMSLFYASKGVTSFLPTTVTAPIEKILFALENIRDAINIGTSGAKILGANVEGPFINSEFRGAHPKEYILHPTIELVEGFIKKSGNTIKIMAIAPESEDAFEVVKHFKDKNIFFAVGHSALTYSEAISAFDSGISHVIHLFNAMTTIHHREPGLAGASLDSDNSTAEIIADGIHVSPAVIRMAIKCKTSENVALITDSTMAAGLNDGHYHLGEQEIIVNNGEARLENGVLAGSTLTMIDAVRNCTHKFNIPLEDSVKMASIVPARILKIDDKKGSISVGKDADIAILDKSLNVIMTIVEGGLAFRQSNN